jgi:hypothetical protein
MKRQIMFNANEDIAFRLQRVVDCVKEETGLKVTLTSIMTKALDDYLEKFERPRGLEK